MSTDSKRISFPTDVTESGARNNSADDLVHARCTPPLTEDNTTRLALGQSPIQATQGLRTLMFIQNVIGRMFQSQAEPGLGHCSKIHCL